ncbi:MAG: hypothetical protein R2880_07900 [Deinococcales bacterium]
MRLRLDPWAAEYNTAYQADEAESSFLGELDAFIETKTWQGISPDPERAALVDGRYESMLFVDGSRRVEARVLLEDDNRQLAFGAIGSYAIGIVSCCPKQERKAEFLDFDHYGQVKRACILSGGHRIDDFEIRESLQKHLGSLRYEIVETEERDVDAVLRRLQFRMLETEREVCSSLTDFFPHSLILSDGPRPSVKTSTPNIVGYLKTIHDLKFGPDNAEILEIIRHLEEGQRSPLYYVKEKHNSRYFFECFLRLRDPRPWLYSLAGMVRLQFEASTRPKEDIERVQQLADWLTLKLPLFASRQHQDPRAPQQLLPIRALESELRRRMGSAPIIRRRITSYLSQN